MNPLTELKKSNPKAYAAFLSLLIALVLLIAWWQIGLAYEDHLITREKETVTSDLARYANSFVNALDRRIALVQGLHSYILMDPSPERLEKRFDLFAAELYESTPGIRNLAAAPDGVQTYVYPYLTNEATLGHNLLNDTRPSVIEQNEQLLSGKKLSIRGPIDLRQGGKGLVISRAIFMDGTWETGTFWGLTTIAIDMPPIYNETGLSAPDLPYEIAMRNDDWGVFYGNPEEFDESSGIINMTLEDETWQIAGCPVGGWGSLVADELSVFQLLTLLVVILITVLCYLILISRLALGRLVDEKTRGLLESEERFRIFFEENPNPCYMIAEDFTILNINATALQLFGYTYKELVGKPLKMIYAPESQDDAEKTFAKWKQEGSVHNQELTILSKDGSRRQVLLNVETVTDSEGRILHSLSVQTDITALRDAECKVSDSEEKYKRLFTHMAEGSALHQIIYDEKNVPVDYRILEVNPEYEKILGLSAVDIVGKTGREVYGQDEAPYLEIYARVAETEVPETFETYYEPLDQYFSVSVYSQKEGYFVTVFSDITERHQDEEALRESEYKFRTLIETANNAIYLHEMDPDGFPGRILLANPAASKMLGYTSKEFPEHTIMDLNDPDYETSLSVMLEKLKIRPVITFEWAHLTKDRRSLPVEISVTIFESGGRTLGVSIVRDISDRKKAEDELKQSLAERGALLSEIHHRVNNNLQVLLSMMTLEEISHQDELASDPLAESLLSDMETRIRAIALVHENIYQSGELTGIRLHDHLLLLAREILTSEIGRVYITYTVEGGEGIVVPMDKAVLLSLVLSEILTNVLKYAFSDKEQGAVTILISEEPEQLCLDISDDGMGMPVNMDLSTTESVGLSMIYNVVTVQLGGTIELLEGKGTTYHICIPCPGIDYES